jgi:Fe-Mn family superoxide dismutase
MFKKIELNYSYNSLEPYISSEIMQLHYEQHHTAYINNLNKALSNYLDLYSFSKEDLAKSINLIPEDIRNIVKNNLGGHINHDLLWQIISPINNSNNFSIDFENKINLEFETVDNLYNLLKQKAISHFGSGWVWLVYNKITKKLEIKSYNNQDSPYYEQLDPIIGIDLWEHSYYLQYKNKKADYVDAALKIINKNIVSNFYNKIINN